MFSMFCAIFLHECVVYVIDVDFFIHVCYIFYTERTHHSTPSTVTLEGDHRNTCFVNCMRSRFTQLVNILRSGR